MDRKTEEFNQEKDLKIKPLNDLEIKLLTTENQELQQKLDTSIKEKERAQEELCRVRIMLEENSSGKNSVLPTFLKTKTKPDSTDIVA